MTWRDKLEIGLKEDAPYRKDNLPSSQVHGREISTGPGRSPEIPSSRPAPRRLRRATKDVRSTGSSDMATYSSHVLALAKHGAALRLRELANELAVLVTAFPDLGDAFDADELPVSFIVRRDARRARAKAVRRKNRKPAAASKRSANK